MEKRTGSKLGKEDIKAVYCHPAYSTSTQSTSHKTRLVESQAGIKTARGTINNLRYAYDTILKAESEKELKSLLMRVKESERAGLRLNIKKKKTKIMAFSPTTAWPIEGE